jgi:hypothetical protein
VKNAAGCIARPASEPNAITLFVIVLVVGLELAELSRPRALLLELQQTTMPSRSPLSWSMIYGGFYKDECGSNERR